jgi:hypothetical protein
MAESAPYSSPEASLIGAQISLFAKLGNLGHKLLVWRDVGCADRSLAGRFADFAVFHRRREFAPGLKTVANLLWGLTAFAFSRLVRGTPGPPEPP